MASRVTRCASVVGPAPFGPGGLAPDDWLRGMAEGNVREFEWSLAGEAVLRPELQRETDQILSGLGEDQDKPLGEGYDLAPSDIEMMARSDIHDMLDESLRVGCA